ncbi:MAG: SDR family oxidoreductase [Oligoflexales bacterium]|nr:SDR family oxidoreductase [Oligoflexales bacterium]
MVKSILVIGATSAIARATIRLFALEGARFFLVARSADKLETLKQDLLARGAGDCHVMTKDLLDFSAHREILDRAVEAMNVIDIVLIAHGTLGDQKECEKNYPLAEKEFCTNFLSVVSLLTIISEYFEPRKSGTIAVISSPAGERGRQSNYIYGAAKGALTVFLSGLRNRLYKNNVKVITIIPGFVDTPMTSGFPKGPLFVKPEVVAAGIHCAITKGKMVVYLPWFWRVIMLIIKMIPEAVFVRLKL